MLAGEPRHRIGQSRRRSENPAVQPVRTLGDVDVCGKVAGQLHERNVHALGPGAHAVVRRRGQRLLQRVHGLAQFGTARSQRFHEGPFWRGQARFHRHWRPIVRRTAPASRTYRRHAAGRWADR